MKMFKKAAALVLAAVLAVGLLAGCGADSRTAEQKIMDSINEFRRNNYSGLEELENDTELQAKGMKILDACAAKQKQRFEYGTQYVLTKAEINQAAGEEVSINWYPTGGGSDVPAGLYVTSQYGGVNADKFELSRRFGGDNSYYIYGNNGYASLSLRTDVKVGVAVREINGELFAIALWRKL